MNKILYLLACLSAGSLFAEDPSPTPQATPVSPPSSKDYTGAPFGGKAAAIPGKIEAENYDEGGYGVAYDDRTPFTNSGDGYRKGEGVDIKGMVLPKGRKHWYQSSEGTPTVGWFFVGEWLHYSVDVTPGTYNLTVKYATPIKDKAIDVYLDGALLASIPTSATGEYNLWGTSQVKSVKIECSGRHLLRIQAAGRDLDEDDIDWIEFSSLK